MGMHHRVGAGSGAVACRPVTGRGQCSGRFRVAGQYLGGRFRVAGSVWVVGFGSGSARAQTAPGGAVPSWWRAAPPPKTARVAYGPRPSRES
eukprot:61164-Prymnesium_polylepis.1